MPVMKPDQVKVRTIKLDTMIDWDTTVPGMRIGDRPDFPSPGAWMYANDKATVHQVGCDCKPGVRSEVGLKLEHFAFTATDVEFFEGRLKQLKERYQRVELTSIKVIHGNVCDPNGNHIHIDFAIWILRGSKLL